MSLLPSLPPAILVLADGTVFRGYAIGASGMTSGEVVFNTAMTGYQEILTDPSYCRQIVTLTYPHIGNVGCNEEDFESRANYAAGLVIRDLPLRAENWRLQDTLPDYLKKHGVVAIAGIDTRKLTRILREKGAQAGCILAGEVNESKALAEARAFPGLAGMDLAKVVTVASHYDWNEAEWTLKGYQPAPAPKYHVVAYDFGVKRNILRMLAQRDSAQSLVFWFLGMVALGAGLLSRMEGWDLAAEMVLQHHEMPDGAGYPSAMPGGQICPGAKILSIIDAFEAVMLKHINRGRNRSVLRAIAEINACDNQFAPEWIEPFNQIIRRTVEA